MEPITVNLKLVYKKKILKEFKAHYIPNGGDRLKFEDKAYVISYLVHEFHDKQDPTVFVVLTAQYSFKEPAPKDGGPFL